MQDSMQQQQARGELAVRDTVHEVKIATMALRNGLL